MRFSNTIAAVAAGLTAGTAVCAEEGSMFKEPPSVTETTAPSILDIGKKEDQRSLKVTRRADGSVSIKGKLHGGRGTDAEFVIPPVKPNVRITGPAGVDENGKPMTWREVQDRKVAHELVFQGLKARGYSYEEQKKLMEGRRTQVDEWREKTEETRREIEKNGPITSKNFIVPGSTPELSKLLSNPEVGVRIENGERVYYLDGKRIDLYPEKKPEGKKGGQAPTQTKTRIRITHKKTIRTAEESAEDSKDASQKTRKTSAKPVKTKKPVENTESFKRPAAPETVINPDALPGINEVEDMIRNAFPDMIPAAAEDESQAPKPKGNPKPVSERTGHESGLLEGVFKSLLGIRSAYAGESDVEKTAEEISGLKSDFPPMTEDEKGMLRGNGTSWKNLGIELEPNKSGSANQYGSAVEEIAKQYREMTSASHAVKDDGLKAGKAEDKTYLNEVAKSKDFDPALFAQEIVNRTHNSLTERQFNEDVAAVMASLNAKAPETIIESLSKILEANPEIYSVIPDADSELEKLQEGLSDDQSEGNRGFTYIFVSYSLTDEAIKETMERNHERNDVVLVMRGVPEGMTIQDGLMRMQGLAGEVDPPASVILDPGLFKAYDVTQVPAVVRVETNSKIKSFGTDERFRKYPPMLAKVTGLNNDEWLMAQLEAGEKGDLGTQGEAREIAEPDLIEVMKEKVASIDWESKKQEAVNRFWTKQEFNVYPTAEEDKMREIDPTILVERDLKDLAGRNIRNAGDRVNPLEIRPFTQTVLIFNPLSEDEMERVRAFAESFRQSEQTGLVLIATQMRKEKGWDGYKELTDSLDSHVYLMTPEIADTWRIQKTPSVITADNIKHVFVVREIGPNSKAENHVE